MEIRPDDRIHAVILAIPSVGGTFLVFAIFIRDGMKNFLQCFLFIKRFVVQEHFTGMMLTSHIIKPVTIDQVDIGIILSEERIRYRYFPDTVFLFRPVGDSFRTFYLDFFSRSRTIDNPLLVAFATSRRIDPFAICTGMYGNYIAREGIFCSFSYCPERSFFGSFIRIVSFDGDVIFFRLHCRTAYQK